MGELLGEMVAVLVEWAVSRLPRGCLIVGCLGLVLIIGFVVLLFVATPR